MVPKAGRKLEDNAHVEGAVMSLPTLDGTTLLVPLHNAPLNKL